MWVIVLDIGTFRWPICHTLSVGLVMEHFVSSLPEFVDQRKNRRRQSPNPCFTEYCVSRALSKELASCKVIPYLAIRTFDSYLPPYVSLLRNALAISWQRWVGYCCRSGTSIDSSCSQFLITCANRKVTGWGSPWDCKSDSNCAKRAGPWGFAGSGENVSCLRNGSCSMGKS